MVQTYIAEFIGVTKYLLRHEGAVRKKGFLVVGKEELTTLLEKNLYEQPLAKLRVWKSLQWIATDDDRVTKRAYDKDSGKYKSVVKIRLEAYETLERLNEMMG